MRLSPNLAPRCHVPFPLGFSPCPCLSDSSLLAGLVVCFLPAPCLPPGSLLASYLVPPSVPALGTIHFLLLGPVSKEGGPTALAGLDDTHPVAQFGRHT